jgi:hypothetical protein
MLEADLSSIITGPSSQPRFSVSKVRGLFRGVVYAVSGDRVVPKGPKGQRAKAAKG